MPRPSGSTGRASRWRCTPSSSSGCGSSSCGCPTRSGPRAVGWCAGRRCDRAGAHRDPARAGRPVRRDRGLRVRHRVHVPGADRARRSRGSDESERGSVVGTSSVFLDLSFGLSPALLGHRRGCERLPRGVHRLGDRVGDRRDASWRCGVARSWWRPDRRDGPRPADGALRYRSMTIERVFVAGAGLMGHGIAQVHAAIGKHVVALRARAGARRGRPGPDRRQPAARGRQGPARCRRARRDARPDHADRRRRPRPPTRPRGRGGLRGPRRQVRPVAASSTGSRRRTTIFASNTSSIAIRRLAESVSERATRAASSGCTSSARCRSCRSSS